MKWILLLVLSLPFSSHAFLSKILGKKTKEIVKDHIKPEVRIGESATYYYVDKNDSSDQGQITFHIHSYLKADKKYAIEVTKNSSMTGSTPTKRIELVKPSFLFTKEKMQALVKDCEKNKFGEHEYYETKTVSKILTCNVPNNPVGYSKFAPVPVMGKAEWVDATGITYYLKKYVWKH